MTDQDDEPKVEIPDDDLVVQILSRLDGEAYRRALYQDAGVRIVDQQHV